MQQHSDKLGRSSSWRRSSDELRKVVRDNLQRPGLLSSHFNDEKSSSTRSFRFSVSNEISSKFCRERDMEEGFKMKAPGLIAKLMGLDRIPLEDMSGEKEKKSKMDSDSPTSMFQFGSVSSRNLEMNRTIVKPKRTTLRSLIEKEQLEVPTNSDRDSEYEARSSSSASTPLSADSSVSLSCDKGLQMKKEVVFLSSFKDMHRSSSVIEEVQGTLPPKNILNKDEIKSVEMALEVDHTDDKDMSRKIDRYEVRGSQNKYELQMKKETSPYQRELKNDTVKLLKRDDDVRKIGLSRINYADKKEMMSVASQISNAKTTKANKLVSLATTEKRLVTSKNSSSLTKVRELPKRNVASQVKSALRGSSTRKGCTTQVGEAKKSTSIKPLSHKDGREISQPCKKNITSLNTMNSSGNYKLVKQSRNSNKDSVKKDKKIVCEIMPKNKKETSFGKREEEITKLTIKEVTGRRRGIGATNLKEILKNSPSFLRHAHELCHRPSQFQFDKKGLKKDENDSKLYLACALELTKRKMYHLKLSSHPMLKTSSHCQLLSENIDQLVLKITENIVTLMSYCSDCNAGDGLYAKLERDLRCQNELNAMWNLSWSSGIYVDEIDRIVAQIEEHVFSNLVEEIVKESIAS